MAKYRKRTAKENVSAEKEKISRTQHDLLFIIPINNESHIINSTINIIDGFLRKHKSNCHFVLLNKSKSDDFSHELKENSILKKYESENLLTLIRPDQSINEYLLALSEENATATDFVLIDQNHTELINGVYQWYTSGNKKYNPNCIYTAFVNNGKKNNVSACANLTMKLFSPVDIKGYESGVFLMSQENLKKMAPCLEGNLKIDIPVKAKLNDIALDYFEIKENVKLVRKPSFFTILVNIIRIQFDWFFKIPVKETFSAKYKKESSILSGNHSFYRLLFGLLIVFALFFMPVISFDYGITWDEPEDHVYFEKVLNYFTTFGEDKSSLDMSKGIHTHLIYYGPLVNLSAAFFHKFISPFGLYETRHIIISLFGFLAILFTGLLGMKHANNRVGFFAALFIFLTPFFFGSSMNNQKDIPFAAFYIISIYYIISFVKQLPRPRLSTRVFLAIAIGLTISIRIAGLLMLAYLALFVFINWLSMYKKRGSKMSWQLVPRYFRYIFFISVFAYFIGIIFWPYALQAPFKNPFIALSKFESFSLVHIWEIFEGKRIYMKDFPWYYIPKSMLITIPLFVLAGLAMIIASLKKTSKKFGSYLLWILFFVLIFPIIYIIYKESAVYSSWRHVYFVYPPLIVLSALGWNRFVELFKNRWVKLGALIILAILIIRPAAWMIKNHPYQYLYYNEITGGVRGAYGNYELDYWCQSPREAAEWLLENEPVYDSRTVVVTNNLPQAISYYTKKKTDSVVVKWARPQEWTSSGWDYAVWTTRTLPQKTMRNGYFPPKGTIHTIEVDGVPLAAIVKKENNYLDLATQLSKEKKYDSAIYYYNKAIAYDPLFEEPYRNLALAYMNLNRFDLAKKNLKKSIELYPDNPVAYYFLGIIAFRENDLKKAEEYARQSIFYKINLSQGYALLGDIYMNMQRFNDAVDAYYGFIRYRGHNPVIYNQIGKAYLAMNLPQKAIEEFKKAIQLNDKFAEAYQNIAFAYSKIGDNANATKYMNMAKQAAGK